MKIDFIFENKDVLVVNKPCGLVVNRSDTNREGTLQDLVSDYFRLENSGIGDRAGIVHRLDRETSGLMVIAKTQEVFEFLQSQFQMRKIKKGYLTLVHGEVLKNSGFISGGIGRIGKFGKFGVVKEGKASVTNYSVERRFSFQEKKFESLIDKLDFSKSRINYLKVHARKYTFLNIEPKTGRTHQIRVHLKSLGHPIVSDAIYAPSKLLKFDLGWCDRLFLHAAYLEFSLPKVKEPFKFRLDLPNDLKSAILNLE